MLYSDKEFGKKILWNKLYFMGCSYQKISTAILKIMNKKI